MTTRNHSTTTRLLCLLTGGLCVLAVSIGADTLTPEASKALDALGSALRDARTGAGADHGNPMTLPTKPLVGTDRKDIVLKLGPPTHECKSDRDVAGCTQRGDLVYSFYVLPTGALGGGPELTFSFDQHDRCVRTVWAISQ